MKITSKTSFGIRLAVASSAAALLFGAAPASADSGTDYLGEITIVGANFCPRGTAVANGQLLQISQYSALYSLLGTSFGGDGRTTFALPNLQGRAAVHTGTGPGLAPIQLGQQGGRDTFQLSAAQIPSHTHPGGVHNHDVVDHSHVGDLKTHTGANTTNDPVGNSFATFPAGQKVYTAGSPDGGNMGAGTVEIEDATGLTASSIDSGMTGTTGSSAPFSVRSPYLGMTFCVNTYGGLFPPRN